MSDKLQNRKKRQVERRRARVEATRRICQDYNHNELTRFPKDLDLPKSLVMLDYKLGLSMKSFVYNHLEKSGDREDDENL